jgi:hypothetical protein
MPRLWLRKLTSIGAVPEGDNPPAAIVLWKTKKGADLVEETEKAADAVEPEVEAVAEPEAVAEVEEDGIAKRIADAEAEIRKARDERDAALQALTDEVAKRRHTDFLAKARTLEPLLGPADETAPQLDALDAANPSAYAELEKRLQVALGRLNLTKELGTAGEEGADPIRKRDAWVRKYVLDHPEISEVAARALFWKANPEALEAQREDQS